MSHNSDPRYPRVELSLLSSRRCEIEESSTVMEHPPSVICCAVFQPGSRTLVKRFEGCLIHAQERRLCQTRPSLNRIVPALNRFVIRSAVGDSRPGTQLAPLLAERWTAPLRCNSHRPVRHRRMPITRSAGDGLHVSITVDARRSSRGRRDRRQRAFRGLSL